ncbi:hypothetical protein BVX95_02395 [archaeon D22]|nr:hypothetical protein BVX95_02395 [archaeon D22]
MELLKRTDDFEQFVFHDKQINHISDLAAVLKEASEEQYQAYVNQDKNDFANWVEHVLNSPEVANRLRSAVDRNATISIIEEEVSKREKTVEENQTSSQETLVGEVQLSESPVSSDENLAESSSPAPVVNEESVVENNPIENAASSLTTETAVETVQESAKEPEVEKVGEESLEQSADIIGKAPESELLTEQKEQLLNSESIEKPKTEGFDEVKEEPSEEKLETTTSILPQKSEELASVSLETKKEESQVKSISSFGESTVGEKAPEENASVPKPSEKEYGDVVEEKKPEPVSNANPETNVLTPIKEDDSKKVLDNAQPHVHCPHHFSCTSKEFFVGLAFGLILGLITARVILFVG